MRTKPPVDAIDAIMLQLQHASDSAYMIEHVARKHRSEDESAPIWSGFEVIGRQLGDMCLDAREAVGKLELADSAQS